MGKIKDDPSVYFRLWDWTLGVVVAGQEPFHICRSGEIQYLHRICLESRFWYEVERIEYLVWGPVRYE